MSNEWTKEVPTAPGFYWFYGRYKGALPNEFPLPATPTMATVVSFTTISIIFVNGVLFEPNEYEECYWNKAIVPPPPKQERRKLIRQSMRKRSEGKPSQVPGLI